jgi:hypothetical protein
MENRMTNTRQPTLKAEGIYEYLLIAVPGKEAYNRIVGLKKIFQDTYQTGGGSRPHITVANFVAKDEMEDTLLRWMQRVIGDQKSFSVTLNNYSGLPPHTIFLRVQDPNPFRRLVKGLKVIDSYIEGNDCPPAWFNAAPFLTLAGKLNTNVYEAAIGEYAKKMFHACFMVDELILLRRQHAHDQCKQIAVLRLQPGQLH